MELLEAQLQEALLSEASGSVARRVRAIRDDAEAVAQALAISAQSPEADSSLAAVRAVLATPSFQSATPVFAMVELVNKLRRERAAAAPEPSAQEKLLAEIRDLLKKDA